MVLVLEMDLYSYGVEGDDVGRTQVWCWLASTTNRKEEDEMA